MTQPTEPAVPMMLSLSVPQDKVIASSPCFNCGFTRFSVMRMTQYAPIPIDTFADLVKVLGQGKAGVIKVIADQEYEIRYCKRCEQPDDEETYTDADGYDES